MGPLVARAADGDEAAWNALVDEFGGLVWATTRAHRLSAADAADVFQITWIRLVENLDRIQDLAHVNGWLATTARRESLSLLRRSTRLIPRADADARLHRGRCAARQTAKNFAFEEICGSGL